MSEEQFTMPLSLFRKLTKTEALIYYYLENNPNTTEVEIRKYVYNGRIIGSNCINVLLSRIRSKGFAIRRIAK